MSCTCGRIRVGMTVTDSFNWNPRCAEHGTESEWWNSPEQVEKRTTASARVRDLQRQAQEARRRAGR